MLFPYLHQILTYVRNSFTVTLVKKWRLTFCTYDVGYLRLLHKFASLSNTHTHQLQQEQQRVAVGPGNAHFISIGQVSSDAATLRLLLMLLCIAKFAN